MSMTYTGFQARLLLECGRIDQAGYDRLPALANAVRRAVEAHNEAVRYLGDKDQILHIKFPGGHLPFLHFKNYIQEVLIAMTCGDGLWFEDRSWSFHLNYNAQDRTVDIACYIDVGHGLVRQYPPVSFHERDILVAIEMVRERLFTENAHRYIDHPKAISNECQV